VAVSPDGKTVYVAPGRSDAVAVFARDTRTGGLIPGGCIQNTGGTDCNGAGGTAPGLAGAEGVAVSPDGKSVYVSSFDSGAVAVFARDTTTGGLTPGGCIQNTGGTDCNASGATAPGLSGAFGVAVSPDGNSAYVASPGSNAIAAFERAAGSRSRHRRTGPAISKGRSRSASLTGRRSCSTLSRAAATRSIARGRSRQGVAAEGCCWPRA